MSARNVFSSIWERLKSWEGFLLLILIIVVAINALAAPGYRSDFFTNQVNLFTLSIERVMVAITMTFLIINGEIDLSAPSIMGLAACVAAYLFSKGMDMGIALVVAMFVGLACGLWNSLWVAIVGLNSLVVTLAMLIAYRGLARVFLQDRSISQFPEWFNTIGQQNTIGPLPLAMVVFFVFFAIAIVILHFSGFGRKVYVIGNSKSVARYSGVGVPRVKTILYVASGLMSALAGLFLAARFGTVRGDIAYGWELDIITLVLLGGVSIFGGSGTLYGVFLSILIILNVRNGMGLLNMSGNLQAGAVGVLLILSVLGPNLVRQARTSANRRRLRQAQAPQSTAQPVEG
jgi:rhamnose transport system permease protein